MTPGVRIDEIDLVPGEPLSEAWVGVHNDAGQHLWGPAAQQTSVPEVVAAVARRPEARRTLVALDDGGRVVAAAQTIRQLRDNAETGGIWLSVSPESRRRGVGSSMLQRAESALRSEGCTRVHEHSGSPVEAGDPASAFALARGYRQTLLDLRQDLALPLDDAVLGELDRPPSPAAYGIETAIDGVPEPWLEDRAHLARRMSTDAPMGDIDLDEEDWDAERVVRQRNSGFPKRRTFEAVAREVESGHLVAFSELDVNPGTPELAVQGDTLVLREHRGHGLGLALKVANLRRLQRELPGVTTVRTWNADTNTPMLEINRRLGFVVSGWTREWAKSL